MLAASSTLSTPSKRGTSPAAAAAGSGGPITSPAQKPTTITRMSPVITRSKMRTPPRRLCTTSSSIEMTPVMTPPTTSGRSNSRYSATAPPMTSATSVAIATSSACPQ